MPKEQNIDFLARPFFSMSGMEGMPGGMRPQMAYKMEASGEDCTDLYIDGVIGEDFDWASWEYIRENTIEEFRSKLKGVTTAKLRVWINSFGGDFKHGISIHDALKEWPGHVTTITSGMTASAATTIAQAGDVRLMSTYSLYLVHKCSGFGCGWFTENDLELFLNDNRAVDKLAIRLYKDRNSKIDEEEIKSLMNEGNGRGIWLNVDEAIEKGFVDEAYDPGTAEEDEEEAGEENSSTQQSAESKNIIDFENESVEQIIAKLNMHSQSLGIPPIPEKKTEELVKAQAAARKRKLKLLELS